MCEKNYDKNFKSPSHLLQDSYLFFFLGGVSKYFN
jgi:hypothetical protein